LIAEARKQYDTILIDTGPILGSIEASPVAVAADGVIVCVACGQQRQLVERALQHLQVIGARLAGVVFNRAQSHDFQQSVSRNLIQSVPAAANGTGRVRDTANSRTIGPVAKAVASSVRPTQGGSAEGN
jgi:Mrp family chromosome partitioning ATPase